MTDNPALKQVEILVKEYERASADIRSIEANNDKIVGFGLTLVGAGFTYGVIQSLVEVFFFLPVASIGVILYTTLQYHNILWIGGYKRAIEDKVNLIIGSDVMIWERVVSRHRTRVHVVNLSMTALYGTTIFAITWYSLYRIFSSHYGVLAWEYMWILLAFLILMGLAIKEMSTAFDRSYRAARELFGLPNLERIAEESE